MRIKSIDDRSPHLSAVKRLWRANSTTLGFFPDGAFDDLLRQEIAFYEGRHDDLIYLAPDFYQLLTRLLDDPQLPARLRPLISSAIAYFILPADIISEELHGPYGYVDDMWLCAYVADVVRRQLDDEAILVENWEGEAPLLSLIREILDKEQDLIGDERDRILWYTGCSQLVV